ncbi:thiamine phosphate synthase [soil metagenome]
MAQALGREARFTKPRTDPRRFPSLWLFTDPDRTPDVEGAMRALPPGCGVVLRTFGRREIEARAEAFRRLARERKLTLLVGADAALAQAIHADGVHLPQRLARALPRLRARFPRWTLTVAAHDAGALRRAEALGADAAFLSPVFESLSPSAGTPLGAVRTSGLVRGVGLPVYALGGVDIRTAPRMRGTGVSGIAGVGFVSTEEAAAA